ncbi:uncharacterized protein LOC144018169 [Festucalex cinctus]
MFKVQMLRALVNERLSAAVEEIFAVLERTIADYEEELCRTKEENQQQRQLLDAVFKPQVDANAPDTREPEPEPPHVKEETAADQNQNQNQNQADLSKLTVTCVIVKSEDEDQSESEEKLDAGKLFPCPRCDKTYSSKGHLKRHARSHAAADVPPRASEPSTLAPDQPGYSCSACNMTFKFHSTFLGHMKKHTGDKSFTCGVCNSAFRFRSTFVNHVRSHTGEKPFACQLCHVHFSAHSSLLRHMRLHTGEKRFSCSFCDKRFPRNASLVEHMRIHTGEKPLTCTVCHMNFRFHSKLIRHMRSHKGDDRPFRCLACGDNFVSKLRLDRHACAAGQGGNGGNGGAQTQSNVLI